MRRPSRARSLPDSIDQQVAIRALQIIARQLCSRALLPVIAQMVLDGRTIAMT